MSPGHAAAVGAKLLSVPLIQCKPLAGHLSVRDTSPLANRPWSIPTSDVLDSDLISIHHLEKKTANNENGRNHIYTVKENGLELIPHGFNAVPRASECHAKTAVHAPSLSTEHLATTYREQPPLSSAQPLETLATSTPFNRYSNEGFCFPKPINLTRDPVLVKHCNNWPQCDQLTCRYPSAKDPSVDTSVELQHDNEPTNADHNDTTVKTTAVEATPSTTETFETRVQKMYDRRRRILSDLSAEELKLHQLLCEEMEITGMWPKLNGHTQSGLCNRESRDTSSEKSVLSAKTANDSSRARRLVTRLKWRNSSRSKSAHDSVSDSMNPLRPVTTQNGRFFRRGMYHGTAHLDDSPSSTKSKVERLKTDTPSGVENGLPTARRVINWWRTNRRRATLVDTKRRQSTAGYPEDATDGIFWKHLGNQLRVRGSSLPPGDQDMRTQRENSEVRMNCVGTKEHEYTCTDVISSGLARVIKEKESAIRTNIYSHDAVPNIRYGDPRKHQRHLRHIPPLHQTNLQAIHAQHNTQCYSLCHSRECNWVQSIPPHTVAGNTYASMHSPGVIAPHGYGIREPPSGNRFRQQPPLSGTQPVAGKWADLRAEQRTGLCNATEDDSNQPPIPPKLKECATQTTNSNGRSAVRVHFNLHSCQQETPHDGMTPGLLAKNSSGSISSTPSRRIHYQMSHNDHLFVNVHKTEGNNVTTATPLPSQFAGNNTPLQVKTFVERTHPISNTRIVYEPCTSSRHISSRDRSTCEQLTPGTWTTFHPNRIPHHYNTRYNVNGRSGRTYFAEWPPHSESAVWFYVPCSRPGRRSEQMECNNSEQLHWVTGPQRPTAFLVSRGQSAQLHLNGTTNVNLNDHVTVKSHRVRLQREQPK